MGELAPERKVVHQTLKNLGLTPFAFEKEAPASPLSARKVWEIDLKGSDVCLVMLYKKIGKYTVDEIELAQEEEIPVLLYVKIGDPNPDDGVAARATIVSQEVRDYVESLDSVETGLTPKRFEQPEELPEEITKSFRHLKRYASHLLKRRAIDGEAPVHGKSRVGEGTEHGTRIDEARRVEINKRPVELRNRVDRFPSTFFGRTKERKRLAKLVERQAFTPVVGASDTGRKSLVQVLAHEDLGDGFADGVGLTPLPFADPGPADVVSAQPDLPSMAPGDDIDDILQSIWEAVYDANGATVEVDRRRLDLKKLDALVALTDVELDEAEIQELVNALEKAKIVATMPEGHAPVGRPLEVAPLSDSGELMEMLTAETDVPVDPAMADLVAAKFASTGGLPAAVGALIEEAFNEVDDEASLAAWLGAGDS
jgi:hypothetical protein